MPNRPTPMIVSSLRPRERREILAALKRVPRGQGWAIALAPALARMLHDARCTEHDGLFVGGVPMVIDRRLAPLGWEVRKVR